MVGTTDWRTWLGDNVCDGWVGLNHLTSGDAVLTGGASQFVFVLSRPGAPDRLGYAVAIRNDRLEPPRFARLTQMQMSSRLAPWSQSD
jgi:hypothetical protein